MKKIIQLCVVAVLSVQLVACSGGDKNKPKTLTMNITPNENSSWYDGGMKLKEIIEKETNGRYTINIFPNEQLSGGSMTKGIENVQNGVTDIDMHSTIIYTITDPKFTVINMPWLIPTYEEADKVMNGKGGEAIFELAREKGVVPLAFGENGYRQMTNNVRAIHKPGDFKGLKIRVPGIKMFLDFYSEVGADPTAMNYAEVFTALQQKTIDGQENPVDAISDSKMDEVQKYLTLSNYVYDALLFSMSQKAWNALSDEDKPIFAKAAKEAMAYQRKKSREYNVQYVEKLKETMEINALTPEEIAVFQEAVKPVYKKWEGIIGLDLMKTFGYEQ